jgi:hypothetical protein
MPAASRLLRNRKIKRRLASSAAREPGVTARVEMSSSTSKKACAETIERFYANAARYPIVQ